VPVRQGGDFVLALLDPLVPGVFGNSLCHLEGILGAGAQLEHLVLGEDGRAGRAGNFQRALEHFNPSCSFLEVHAEKGFSVRLQRGIRGSDLIDVFAFRHQVKGCVTLMEGHAINLSAGRGQSELSEFKKGKLAQAGCGSVLEFYLRKSVLCA
jgi:hypothetical protein